MCCSSHALGYSHSYWHHSVYTLVFLHTHWCLYVYIGISTSILKFCFIHICGICITPSSCVFCYSYISICTYTHIGISLYTLGFVRIYFLHFWQCIQLWHSYSQARASVLFFTHMDISMYALILLYLHRDLYLSFSIYIDVYILFSMYIGHFYRNTLEYLHSYWHHFLSIDMPDVHIE